MRTIKEIPDFDRPREKLALRGPEALSDTELLAILLGSGVKGKNVFQVASTILKKLDMDQDKVDVQSLEAIEGVGVAKASAIIAALEFSRRRLIKNNITIKKAEDVVPLLSHIADKKQEYFLCLSLNGANELINNRVVTVGLLNSSQVHPREVFADVIADRAASVIVAHNHPSGSLKLSPDDIAITKQLVDAGNILGISLLGHIIISKKGFISMKEKGYL
jgi:DNA repair protein RadC